MGIPLTSLSPETLAAIGREIAVKPVRKARGTGAAARRKVAKLAEMRDIDADLASGRTMRVTLPFPPSTNHLYATSNGNRVLSKAGRQYKEFSARLAQEAGFTPLACEVELSIDVYRPKRTGDLANREKLVADSLTGLAWHDDSQIRRLVMERYECRDNPRVEVTVRPSRARAMSVTAAFKALNEMLTESAGGGRVEA